MAQYQNFDASFFQALDHKINEVEAHTKIEVVLHIQPQSAKYIDPFYKAGLLGTFITILLLVFLPFPIHPLLILPDMLLGLIVFGTIGQWIIPVKRWLVGLDRKKRHTKRYANALFWHAGYWKTRERTAVLICISTFEQQTVCIEDELVLASIPEGELKVMEAEFQAVFTKKYPPQAILNALSACDVLFAKYLPPDETNPNELSNVIREVDL